MKRKLRFIVCSSAFHWCRVCCVLIILILQKLLYLTTIICRLTAYCYSIFFYILVVFLVHMSVFMSFRDRGMGKVHVFLYQLVIFFCVQVLGIWFLVCFLIKYYDCDLQGFVICILILRLGDFNVLILCSI